MPRLTPLCPTPRAGQSKKRGADDKADKADNDDDDDDMAPAAKTAAFGKTRKSGGGVSEDTAVRKVFASPASKTAVASTERWQKVSSQHWLMLLWCGG